MIVVKAPLRVSFVGGGTDISDFYNHYQGRVLSCTIDQYIYIAINRTPLIPKISVRYKVTETVNSVHDLQNTRVKAALLDLGIKKGLEIASFGDLPAKTGLGSSSSFSVALLKGLYTYLGKKLEPKKAAEYACRLEIELLGEPIGKQDQYAAAFGGLNIIEFNPDQSVKVLPIFLDAKKKRRLENHIIVFYTGLTRSASSVLKEQKNNIRNNVQILQKMASSVDKFKFYLINEKYEQLGTMLHEGWLYKKSLVSLISNSIIDDLYETAMKQGAWGGKLLGAGGGGCLLFFTPINKKKQIRESLEQISKKKQLNDFKEIPIRFVQSGVEVLINIDRGRI